MSDPSAASPEDRLRERLASYGAALDRAGDVPVRRRHLVAVDGAPASAGAGAGAGRRRPPWRGPVVRVAAAAAVLAVLAGTTWAATRPTNTSTTTTAEGGWRDDDIVRPEDRESAFAALDGTWPLPDGASLRYVIDRRETTSQTFAELRQVLASNASCLWFRHAYEEPSLSPEERSTIRSMPTWPGHAEPSVDGASDEVLAEVVTAALSSDAARLRRYLTTSCGGSGRGLGLPEIGGYWLAPQREGDEPTAIPDGSGTASTIDPAQVPGWERIVERLGPDVRVDGAVALPDGAVNIRLSAGAAGDVSLTIGRLRSSVALPVDEAVFDRGYSLRDGVEVFAGSVDGGTIAHAVGADGTSLALASDRAIGVVEDALGTSLADLAVDLHGLAWPR